MRTRALASCFAVPLRALACCCAALLIHSSAHYGYMASEGEEDFKREVLLAGAGVQCCQSAPEPATPYTDLAGSVRPALSLGERETSPSGREPQT